jgi:major membrane immunogen (membrane-anchored lipoprotein)
LLPVEIILTMEGQMNEKNKFVCVFVILLFIWAVSATGYGILINCKYKSLQSVIDKAGGDEFVKLVEQHGESVVRVYDDYVAIRGELESANERADTAERIAQSINGIARQSDVEFAEFRNAMGSYGTSIKDAIRFQQTIIDIVGRLERNNQAIKAKSGGGA